MFLLHGNVRDLVPVAPPGQEAASGWGTVSDFLAREMFGRWDIVLAYDVGKGLRPLAGPDPNRLRAMAQWLTERLGLSKLLDRYPEQLSGGQQQRVAIGRALAGRPQLILADEPTGNLDEATGDAILELMLALMRETGAALLMVTHSNRLASRLGRRLHLAAGKLG